MKPNEKLYENFKLVDITNKNIVMGYTWDNIDVFKFRGVYLGRDHRGNQIFKDVKYYIKANDYELICSKYLNEKTDCEYFLENRIRKIRDKWIYKLCRLAKIHYNIANDVVNKLIFYKKEKIKKLKEIIVINNFENENQFVKENYSLIIFNPLIEFSKIDAINIVNNTHEYSNIISPELRDLYLSL